MCINRKDKCDDCEFDIGFPIHVTSNELARMVDFCLKCRHVYKFMSWPHWFWSSRYKKRAVQANESGDKFPAHRMEEMDDDEMEIYDG